MARNNNDEESMYVYDLPLLVRAELCRILNQNEKWVELAGHMNYDFGTVQFLRQERNPTDELLTMWSHYNHNVLELYIILSDMEHYRAMVPLKPFVNPKYHILVDNGRGNLANLFTSKKKNLQLIDLMIDPENFNNPESTQPTIPKVVVVRSSNEQSPMVEQPSNSNNMLPSLMPPTRSPILELIDGITNEFHITTDMSLPLVSYEELTRATDMWNRAAILGKGGYGTVFKGSWKNTQVAIKRIDPKGKDKDESYRTQLRQSLVELKFLNSYRHDNILSLYAYSIGGVAPCLVYQYMPNGSLEYRLFSKQKTRSLTLRERFEIAKGTARGLQFLHTIGEKPLIHGDIKSANILLDKNLEPRIGDFGLAREGSETDCMQVSRIEGTKPYLPDEFVRGRNLSIKVDTYSYGIVMFELATGLPAYDESRPEHKFLKDFMDCYQTENEYNHLIDKSVGEMDKTLGSHLIKLGKWCSNKWSKNRPEMVLVLKHMEG